MIAKGAIATAARKAALRILLSIDAAHSLMFRAVSTEIYAMAIAANVHADCVFCVEIAEI